MKRAVVAAVAIVVVASFVGLLELRQHHQAQVASNRASTIRPAPGGPDSQAARIASSANSRKFH
jgi:hypothetical protein